jgi:UDP-glucuronate 4-epimerase
MRALVTGCAGFIGSHLAESLLRDGHSVVGIDCFNDNYGRPQKLDNVGQLMSWDGFEFVPVDLARGDLGSLTDDCDTIFHLAAEPGVRPSWRAERFDLYNRNNVLATQHLLTAIQDAGPKKFVYASSSSIYGDTDVFPTPENAVPRPVSPYGMSKLSGEHLCHMYNKYFGTETVSLRYFTVFGPRQRPDMAFNRFCRAAIEGTPITVYGDGRQTRDFTFVDDVIAATRAAAAPGIPGDSVFNIGGGTPASVRDVLDLLTDFADGDLQVDYVPAEAGDVRDTQADTTAARETLGFAPTTALREGLAAEFEWVRSTAPATAG